MVYPGNYYRLVVEGRGYGPERWSWSLSLAEPGGSIVGASPNRVPPSIVLAVEQFHVATGVICAPAEMDLIKFNPIKPDGKYLVSTDTVRKEYLAPVPGQATGAPPPQLSLAVTLTTARSRGRGSRGRFYPPYPASTTLVEPDTGQVPPLAAERMANAAADLVNSLNAATDPDNPDVAALRVVVASDIGTGLFEEVTSVNVGRVVDTMRSRRTSLDEARVVSTTAIAGSP